MFAIPDLPYEAKALEPYIDEATMLIHHDKHHATYVQNLNDALKDHPELLKMHLGELLKDLGGIPENIRTKVRNNGGGHANHSLFWEIMGPQASTNPSGMVEKAIKETYGDFSTFQERFATAGLGRFGSGWVWLVAHKGRLEIVDTPNQDTPLMEGKTPILCLDVWEHAYYLKYQNKRVDYISAWWNVVNWSKVEENFRSASK